MSRWHRYVPLLLLIGGLIAVIATGDAYIIAVAFIIAVAYAVRVYPT